jgi:hypothetical protein|tara:strand:+ start:25 stop:183 length:159 start_codon:yes stop_codon:yes gene_type:complete
MIIYPKRLLLDIIIVALIWDVVLRKLILGLTGFKTPILLLGYFREALRFMLA